MMEILVSAPVGRDSIPCPIPWPEGVPAGEDSPTPADNGLDHLANIAP